ncbi:MAG: Gfo/Idh/MocA family oxidoreductase [Pirellulaceae bacterium]|nr:Gfo/Idh/MocA family oxidoreductase [Pirellulaceae bacterium]
MMNRRDAMKGVAAGIAASGMCSTASGRFSSETLVIGAVGCGGRGRAHAKLLAGRKDVRISHVCDPDLKRAEQAANDVEKVCGKKPVVVQDIRRVLDDASVDAITVATPDHWHAPATILACKAGKHVYVEKPCSHNVREGRLMIEAARKYKRVVQVGTQARNSKHVRRAMQLLREGAIGDVLVAKAWDSQ